MRSQVIISRFAFGLVAVIIAVAAAGCVGIPTATQAEPNDIYRLIERTVSELAPLLKERDETVVAVSFFVDEDGAKSPFSNELSDGLTTELANAVGGTVTVVSRRAVEQILDEVTFQLSELVDEETQADLGRQLGADVILTGSVTGGPERFTLNAQLIEVESAVVIGGTRVGFETERIQAGAGITTVVVEPDILPTVQTPNLTLTLIEQFDTGAISIAPAPREDFWGERIVKVSGKISPAPSEGPDGSTALAYEYRAEFDRPYDISAFSETGVLFSVSFDLPPAPADASGITLDVHPGDASLLYFRLLGQDEEGYDAHGLFLTVSPGTWTRLALPFDLFAPDVGAPALDVRTPLSFEIAAPYTENVHLRAFGTGANLEGRLLVDNIGHYRRDTPLPAGSIAGMDGFEIRAAITADLYGSFAVVDYDRNEEEVLVMTPGVVSFSIQSDRKTPGLVGNAQRISLVMEVDDSFAEFVESGRQLILSGSIQAPVPAEAKELLFSIRSDTLTQGDLDLYLPDDYSVYQEFPVSGFWNDVVMPVPERSEPGHALIQYRLPVRRELTKLALESGVLILDVVFDEFRYR